MIKEFIIDPKTLGIDSANKENLKGKNAEYNSEKIIEIFKGKNNEFSQSVALNVAAGLIVSGKESDFKTVRKGCETFKFGTTCSNALSKNSNKLMTNILEKIIEEKSTIFKLN